MAACRYAAGKYPPAALALRASARKWMSLRLSVSRIDALGLRSASASPAMARFTPVAELLIGECAHALAVDRQGVAAGREPRYRERLPVYRLHEIRRSAPPVAAHGPSGPGKSARRFVFLHPRKPAPLGSQGPRPACSPPSPVRIAGVDPHRRHHRRRVPRFQQRLGHQQMSARARMHAVRE